MTENTSWLKKSDPVVVALVSRRTQRFFYNNNVSGYNSSLALPFNENEARPPPRKSCLLNADHLLLQGTEMAADRKSMAGKKRQTATRLQLPRRSSFALAAVNSQQPKSKPPLKPSLTYPKLPKAIPRSNQNQDPPIEPIVANTSSNATRPVKSRDPPPATSDAATRRPTTNTVATADAATNTEPISNISPTEPSANLPTTQNIPEMLDNMRSIYSEMHKFLLRFNSGVESESELAMPQLPVSMNAGPSLVTTPSVSTPGPSVVTPTFYTAEAFLSPNVNPNDLAQGGSNTNAVTNQDVTTTTPGPLDSIDTIQNSNDPKKNDDCSGNIPVSTSNEQPRGAKRSARLLISPKKVDGKRWGKLPRWGGKADK